MAKSISHNNLIVSEEDYWQGGAAYTNIAATVQQEWHSLIEMFKPLQHGSIGGEKVMQGNFADKIAALASTQWREKPKTD